MSKVTFRSLGGGSSIGANCYAVGIQDEHLLLDCGVHPKKEGPDALPSFSGLESPPLGVIVSHAHIDHCGAVPCLLKRFPSVECYATIPTLSIMDRMLHNSVAVMETLALEQGISGYPLYSHRDVDNVLRQSYGLGFQREFALSSFNSVHVSFHYSGHVLGSASVLIRTPGHTLLYTGDICMSHQELMAGLTPLDPKIRIDTLVIESTRAAHANGRTESFQNEVARFARETAKVLKRGGAVLAPSFALGRSQELLNIISRLIRIGKIPSVPVYASGLSRAIYEIYSRYSQYLKPDVDLRPLFEFPRIGDVWELSVRRELLRTPSIIVATSGMMLENTPSAIIAQEMVKSDRHGIFFVGYLDPDTLGYRLLHAQTGDTLLFELGGRPVAVALENRQSFNLSAHAHRDELLRLIYTIRPKNVVFIHGDPDAIEWMDEHCDGDFQKYRLEEDETIVLEA